MRPHASAAILLVLTCLLAAGCVERKLLLRSDPPGATVALNREAPLQGVTPLEVPFDFYGGYEVRMNLPGYEDLEAVAPVDPPWWSWPPFDFLTEIVWPFTIRDHRVLEYALTPLPPARSLEESEAAHREFRERAEAFRGTERETTGGEAR